MVEKGKVKQDRRMAIQAAEVAIRSIDDVIKELVTNVDDSYERQAKASGIKRYKEDCLIEYDYSQHNNLHLYVKDKAEGMTGEKLKAVLENMGKYQSEGSGRGINARGIHDITILGLLKVYTLKKGKYSEGFTYIKAPNEDEMWGIEHKDTTPSKSQLKLLGLKHNKSGTVFKLTINREPGNENFIKLFSTLKNKIPQIVALKNILIEPSHNCSLNLYLQEFNKPKTKSKLNYIAPKKKLVNKIIIKSKKIDEYKAEYKINSDSIFEFYELDKNAIDNLNSRAGIYIEGNKQVFQKDFLIPELSSSPYKERIYGILKSELYDAVQDDYKNTKRLNEKRIILNPFKIDDNNRRLGIENNHPLHKELIKEPKRFILSYLKKLSSESNKIEHSKHLQNIFSKLSKFFKKEFNETENLSDDSKKTLSELALNKWQLIPDINNLKVNEEYSLNLYVHSKNVEKGDVINLLVDKNATENIKLINKSSEVRDTIRIDRKKFAFKVIPLLPKENVQLTFELVRNKKSSIATQKTFRIENYQDRTFTDSVEFEFQDYELNLKGKNKGSRTIKAFADIKNVNISKACEVHLDNPKYFTYDKEQLFKRFKNTNYAMAEIEIKGNRLGEKSRIQINLDDKFASSFITVKDSESKNQEDDWSIELVERNMGNFRYEWDNKKLMITLKSKVMEKVIGDYNQNNNYQKSKEFKIVLAETLADAASEKYILEKLKSEPDLFSDLLDVEEKRSTWKNKNIIEIYNLIEQTGSLLISKDSI